MRPKGNPAIFGPLVKPTFRTQRKAAAKKSEKAREKLPARPVPAIPLLRNPTHAQRLHAAALIQRSFKGQLPKNASLEDRQRVATELRRDPRTALPVAIGQTGVSYDRARALLSAARLRGEQMGVPHKQRREATTVGLSNLPAPVMARPHAHHPGALAQALRKVPVSAVQAELRLASHLPVVGGVAKAISHQADKELSATGAFAKESAALAKWVGKHGVAIQTGGGPAGAAAKHYGGGTTATIVPHAVKLSDNGLARRTLQDLINFPAQFPASVYQPGSAVVSAVRGNSKPLKDLGKNVVKTDPFIQLATGHPGKALKLAEQHPGFAGLEAVGLKGTLGRGLGHVLRSPELPARTVEGTAIAEHRPKTGDFFTDTYRAKRHAAAVKKSQALHAKANKAAQAGDHVKAKDLRAQARTVDPNRATNKEIRRRVSEVVSVNELNRRQNVQTALHEADKALGKNPTAAHTFAAQNLANDRAGLIAYRDRIIGEQKNLAGPKLDANHELVGQIDHALKSHDPKVVETAARKWADHMNSQTQQMKDRGLLSGEAERRPLLTYAVEHMGAKRDPAHYESHDGERLTNAEVHHIRANHGDQAVQSLIRHVPDRFVTHDGHPLTNDAIRADMQAKGLGDPAFVTHAPSARGAGNFYRSATSPPMVGRAHFTGEAVKQGTWDAHPDVLREGSAKAANLISAADGWTQAIHEIGVRKPNGKLRTRKTKREADRVAEVLSKPGGTKYVAVRLNPLSGSKEQLAHLLDHQHVDAQDAQIQHNPIQEALISAAKGEDGPGDWAIVPWAGADQLFKHARTLGATDIQKTFQAGTQMFSRSVLATSPTWLTGNVSETGLRAAFFKAGPGSYRFAKKTLDTMTPQERQSALNRMTSGGMMSTAGRPMHRGAGLYDGDTRLGKAAAGVGAAKEAPVGKQLAAGWNWYTDKIFRAVNGRFEQAGETAMLGRALKNAGYKSVQDAANGLKNTNNQVQFAREIERAYGKYSAYTPDQRWLISMYTPFIPWAKNAVRFVYDVLPRDHPTVTALVVASERANEDWLKAHGRNQFASGHVPGFLQTTLPIPGGRSVPIGRYTPFGAFGDPGATIKGAVLPQLSGVLSAFGGQDWKGKPLRKANGQPADFLDEAKVAALSFLEGTVPIVGAAQRVVKKGPVGFLNPYAPIKPKGGSGGVDVQNPALKRRAERLLHSGQGNPAQQQMLQRRAARLLAQMEGR